MSSFGRGCLMALAMLAATPSIAQVQQRTVAFAEKAAAVQLNVRVQGNGPLVVLIPSLGRGAADFDALGARLAAAGYTAAAIDPRGIGGSSGPPPQTLFDLAGDVAAVIEALAPVGPDGAPRPAIVIGHALGNRIARTLASAHPAKVSQLILLASGGQVPIAPAITKAMGDVFDTSLSPKAHIAAVKAAFFAPGNDPEVWRDGWYPAVAQAQERAVRATVPGKWTNSGAAPVLIVQAMDDAIAPPANAEALQRAAPDRVEIVILQHAGHAMLPEQPGKLADIVLKRLTKAPRL